MPVIVVGADTTVGRATVEALLPGVGELRVFISDPAVIDRLKRRGIKVAVGDISDGSHVGGAALNAFCAVLIGDAAADERERSFADSPDAVVAAWAEGLRDAGVHRAIWVGDDSSDAAAVLAASVAEFAQVDAAGRSAAEVAEEVVQLEARPEV